MIFEILTEGAENARTGKEICKLLNITARDLTLAIERERRAGKPICAATGSNPGYFLAANQEEMQRYCNSLMHRAGEIHKTRRACIKTMAKLPAGEAEKSLVLFRSPAAVPPLCSKNAENENYDISAKVF